MNSKYDIPKIAKMLEGFRKLPVIKWDQRSGGVFPGNNLSGAPEGECGACVGAWMAYFLEEPVSITSSGDSVWCFEHGRAAFSRLLYITDRGLRGLLHFNGAPFDPFGTNAWRDDFLEPLETPYHILCATVKELTGYDHKSAIQNEPIAIPMHVFAPQSVEVGESNE